MTDLQQPGVTPFGKHVFRFDYMAHGQPVDWPTVFGRQAPLELEIGSGSGEFLTRIAERQPEADHLGVEIKTKRIVKFARRLERHGLDNVRILHADASRLLPCVVGAGTLRAIYVLFPDPWPKARHAKNRIINPWTASLFAELLAPCGRLHVATDDQPYLEIMRSVLGACPALTGPEYDADISPFGFPTRYETYWIAEKRTIRYLSYSLA